MEQNSEERIVKKNKSPRDSKGRLLPGYGSLNPGGKSDGMRAVSANLHKALRKIEKGKRQTFLEHYVELAFTDRTMAIALLKKLVPDLKAVDITSEDKAVWNVILQNFIKPKEKTEKQ